MWIALNNISGVELKTQSAVGGGWVGVLWPSPYEKCGHLDSPHCPNYHIYILPFSVWKCIIVGSAVTTFTSQRIRRNVSGQKQDAITQAIHINCFDVRRVKLLFIIDDDCQSHKLPGLDGTDLGQKLSRLAALAVGGGRVGEGGGEGGVSPNSSPKSVGNILQ